MLHFCDTWSIIHKGGGGINLNDIIRQRRKQIGKTLDDVAHDVQVSKATVQRWETGSIKNMRRDKLIALARSLNTTPDYLIGATSDPERGTHLQPLEARLLREETQERLQEHVFNSMLDLCGLLQTCDGDANVTIYREGLSVNRTPELIREIMNEMQDYFMYQLDRRRTH